MSHIQLLVASSILAAMATATVAAGQGFDLSWYTIDGGGGTSAGGGFELSGTIGQPDAGSFDAPLTDASGTFQFIGGFWPVAAAITAPLLRGDMNCDGVVNNFDIDPFVLAILDPVAYAVAYPTCNVLNGDVGGDGVVNNFDIDPFVACILNGGCP